MAGKGGAIKRITEYLSPRVARIVALPTPTERERGQWYFQRYIAHLPSRGEMVLFDRSWYNRPKVMGFCTPEEYYRFLRQTPVFEQMLIDDGIILRKYWFSVSDKEQLRRFRSRHADPVRRWKLSPMDLESINRWEDYSGQGRDDAPHRYPDQPMVRGGVRHQEARPAQHDRAPAVEHPYTEVPAPEVKLPKRLTSAANYRRPPRDQFSYVPDHAATILGDPEANS